MNPAQIQDSCGMLAKPRSRGDEPAGLVADKDAHAKTPLTRG